MRIVLVPSDRFRAVTREQIDAMIESREALASVEIDESVRVASRRITGYAQVAICGEYLVVGYTADGAVRDHLGKMMNRLVDEVAFRL